MASGKSISFPPRALVVDHGAIQTPFPPMTTPESPTPPLPKTPPSAHAPSPLRSLLLLLLPCLGCVALNWLSKILFHNNDTLILPLLATFLVGPWIVGIIAARRMGVYYQLKSVAQVLLAVGFIVASFALCFPGCAVNF